MSSGSRGSLGSTTTRAYTQPKTGPIVWGNTATRYVTDDRQNWGGGSVSNFYKRVKAGELLPYCAYRKFEMLSFQNNCVITSRYVNGATDNTTGWSNGHPGVMPYLLSEDDLFAQSLAYDAKPYVQAAAAKIASSGFDLLTFVAELRQTYTMWRDVGKTITALLNRSNGSAVNSWLQYRYGWRCLYYDMLNIQKLINSMDEKRVRVKERVGRDYTSSNITQYTTDWSSSTTVWQIEDRITCGVRGLVCADIDVPPIRINPFITAWELVKFSFIIDWFIQVGQWINTMTFLSAEEKHYACGSYALTCERTITKVSQQMKPYFSYTTWSINQSQKARLLLRVPTGIPLGLQTTLKLDAFKVADLVALVLQALKRR